MEAVIRKWGNSPALRLSSAVLRDAGYQIEQKVELVVSRGRIIIQPSKKVEYALSDLDVGKQMLACLEPLKHFHLQHPIL